MKLADRESGILPAGTVSRDRVSLVAKQRPVAIIPFPPVLVAELAVRSTNATTILLP